MPRSLASAGLPLYLPGDEKTGLLPHHHSDSVHDASPNTRSRQELWRGITLLAVACLFSAGYLLQWRPHKSLRLPFGEVAISADVGLPKEVQQAWAAHSPYFPAAAYIAPPERCEVVQVSVLQRHGTRLPTASNSKRMQKPLKKLLKAGKYSDKRYRFLSEFKWDLGTDDLLPLGEKEAFDSGFEHYLRYKHLIEEEQLPFIRASGSERVVESAETWAQGFAAASEYVYWPNVSVVISEKEGANNTLDDSMCPNAKAHKTPGKAWRDEFIPPIVERINKAVPGAKLGNGDVAELMPLCAFETVYHEIPSPFCGLFTTEEWLAHEYYNDLLKYYKTGHGGALGPVQGVGYINELLARLTGQPVRDATQTNRTLDASPDTFPLDRTLYADFSHDNQMVAIYSAIGLFRPEEPPATDRLDLTRVFRISRMTPFGGRLITEKLRCDDGEAYVRMLVNDAVQPLAFCGATAEGLCALDAFVESQAYARNNGNGDWEKCFS